MQSSRNFVPVHDKVVLVPTDFSDICRNAISHGVRSAARIGLRVCLLHVITKESRTVMKRMRVREEYLEWRLAEYKKYYEKKYKVVIETMVAEGDIEPTILEIARKIKASLLVLGAKGKTGLLRIFGNNALRIIAESLIPVIVVQKISYRPRYNTVVFPVHAMIRSFDIVRWTRVLSGFFSIKFHLLLLSEKDPGLKERLAELTGMIADNFDVENRPELVITTGKSSDFAKDVISYTLSQHADMIMMVSSTATDAKRFRFTSTDEKLMFNEAQIPVMFLNPEFLMKQHYESR